MNIENKQADIFELGGVASKTAQVESESKWLRQHFKLPYNPFPPSGISSDNPEGPPLTDQQGRDIAPLIRDFLLAAYREQDTTQGLVIIGTYGTGKTHLLRLMHDQINERLGSGEQRANAIFVDRPRVEVQDLNRSILKSLGEDTIRKWLWYAIKGQIAEDIANQASRLMDLRRKVDLPLFGQTRNSQNRTPFEQVFNVDNLEDYRKFLRASDAEGWRREQLRTYFGDLVSEALQMQSPIEMIDSFVALLVAPDESTRTTWESLLALGQKRKIPLMSAPEFLGDLLRLMQINGYVYTFLLIDEFEEVPAGTLLTTRQKSDYMFTLMEILNKVRRGLGLVLALTPEAWEILTAEAKPLQDRLPNVIRLGDLDVISIQRLITFYLERARQDANIKADDPLFPFTENDIFEIVEKMRDRTPRNVVQYASRLISYCVSGQVTTITPSTIRSVLDDYSAGKTVPDQRKRTRVKGA